jgi:hypothetical protein
MDKDINQVISEKFIPVEMVVQCKCKICNKPCWGTPFIPYGFDIKYVRKFRILDDKHKIIKVKRVLESIRVQYNPEKKDAGKDRPREVFYFKHI